jgi:hypothetical protein
VAAGAVAIAGMLTGYFATQDEGTRHAVPWTDVTAKIGSARWARATTSIIRDREKLANLLEVATLPPHPSPPAIDFTRRQAVLIAVGPRSSTGFSLHVESVTERGGRIDVVVRERTPTAVTHVVPELTFPFRLITIPANRKHVHVRYAGRS